MGQSEHAAINKNKIPLQRKSMSYTKSYPAVFLGIALLAITSVYADDTPDEIKRRIGGGDPVAGKEKSAQCRACHGEDGNSAAPNVPKLAGQYADYLYRQINNFQTGARKDPVMTKIAATVTDHKGLSDIASYFASQKQMTGPPVKNEVGEKLFLDKGCLNCHGEIGKGKPAYNSINPVIGGQHKDYLVKQLNDFKTGARDTDISGAMSELANQITDAEMQAVAEYLSGQ
ncbi:MAG: c-type cytochrome [Gallionella sp.]